MNSLLHKNPSALNQFIPHGQQKSVVQPKLSINAPGDDFEQEADAMAERVMRMPANENHQGPKTGIIGASIQRKCTSCEEEEKKRKPIMRKTENGSGGIQAAPSLVSALNASKGGGSPLSSGTRSFMENAYSANFSKVRIHTDEKASEMSEGINAKAFTHGSDIYFKSGLYQPGTGEGKRLLAHELTHVVQQGIDVQRMIQRDLAVELPNPDAVFDGFNGEQIDDAIAYNIRQRFTDADILIIKDVLGVENLTSEIDEEFINAVGEYQAQNNITPDGKIGGVTATRLARELRAEGRYLGRTEGADLMAASRRMARRGLAIAITVNAAQNNASGSATYRVNFGISDRGANGWIIQHVIFSANAVNCAGNAVASVHSGLPNINYWEGWRVVNGVINCGLAGVCALAHDTFTTINEAANTRGTIRVRGRVTFVPDYQLNLPPWQTGGGHPAGILPHRNTPPENWSDSDARLHQLTITYDNCAAVQPNLVLNTIP